MIRTDPIELLLTTERPWFFEPRASAEFVKHVGEIDAQVPSDFLFNRTGTSWFLEALTIAEYLGLRDIERACLNKLDPPDAYVFESGKKRAIEITEVLEPGRQRGRDYRRSESVSEGGASDWRRRAEQIAPALREGIGKKVRKSGVHDTLLVYLNVSDFGIRHSESENDIVAILNEYAAYKIEVIWKRKLYSKLSVKHTST